MGCDADEGEVTEPGGRVRLYVESPLSDQAELSPDESQTHYLLHVMRAKAGMRVLLFNGRDGEWSAEIATVTKRGCRLRCLAKTAPQTQPPDLWLLFAPIKKTPADYLTQKACELGVRVLQPVITRRTIVTRVNLERMRANAHEAAEQSGRTTVPEVRAALSLDALLAGWPQERRLLFCDEGGDARPIRDVLRGSPPAAWAILIGPEGGFDPIERARLRALAGVTPATLGPRILRADTAALAALALWQSECGDWR